MTEPDHKQPACDYCLDTQVSPYSGATCPVCSAPRVETERALVSCGSPHGIARDRVTMTPIRVSHDRPIGHSLASAPAGRRLRDQILGAERAADRASDLVAFARTATRPRVLGPARVVVGVSSVPLDDHATHESERRACALEFAARALEATGESGTADAVVLLRQLADQERAS